MSYINCQTPNQTKTSWSYINVFLISFCGFWKCGFIFILNWLRAPMLTVSYTSRFSSQNIIIFNKTSTSYIYFSFFSLSVIKLGFTLYSLNTKNISNFIIYFKDSKILVHATWKRQTEIQVDKMLFILAL